MSITTQHFENFNNNNHSSQTNVQNTASSTSTSGSSPRNNSHRINRQSLESRWRLRERSRRYSVALSTNSGGSASPPSTSTTSTSAANNNNNSNNDSFVSSQSFGSNEETQPQQQQQSTPSSRSSSLFDASQIQKNIKKRGSSLGANFISGRDNKTNSVDGVVFNGTQRDTSLSLAVMDSSLANGPVSMTYGSVDALRNRFLDFVKSCGSQSKHLKNPQLDEEFEVKLLFMDYFYDGSTRKPSKLLKDVPTVLTLLDVYCHHLVFHFDDWHSLPESEDEYPYFKHIVETVIPDKEKFKWMNHSRFEQFLIEKYQDAISKDYPPLRSDEILLNQQETKEKESSFSTTTEQTNNSLDNLHARPTISLLPENSYQETEELRRDSVASDDSSTSDSNVVITENSSNPIPKPTHRVGVLEEIHMLCDMFFYELEDLFVLYQEKNQNYVHKWVQLGLKNGSIPTYVIEVYRKKLEYNESTQSQFTVDASDFVSQHVIDKDWKFLRYMCKEYSPDWYCSYKDIGNVVQWTTKRDYTTDNLKLRNSKIVGYINLPMEDVVKSFSFDHHFSYAFENIEFHNYHPINASNSLHKYPSATVSGTFNLSSVFSKRSIEQVISCRSVFVGNELTEHMILFKSCDLSPNESSNSKKGKVKFMGLRLVSKIDNNRTRYCELRSGNLGGVLNSSLIINNPIINKKVVKGVHGGLINVLKLLKNNGFPFPDEKENHVARVWIDYCKQYCNVDVKSLYGQSAVRTIDLSHSKTKYSNDDSSSSTTETTSSNK
ncbi:predicted protein [Naegleria gruberi]|uniref:Predicted protein n=1 Tax=Naegleria gruberi TaxID=5762 RepID=D2VZ85_NAEGR|nr:uncharacterized protein NAEGRDRAFT_74399 [Naegleria gruberi]EFC37898.1 predicted protein [Naegleria gruberi]|eukprot:XP_002670642.1 predicted protein [Naegleria gruberi strain NEG-M]